MAVRPWVTPEEVISYSESSEVKKRAADKLIIDIARAEQRVVNYTNNDFSDVVKYPTIPDNVRFAVILLAEVYAQNAIETVRRKLRSETFDDYSYTVDSGIIDIDSIDIASLLDSYAIPQSRNAVTMRLRKL